MAHEIDPDVEPEVRPILPEARSDVVQELDAQFFDLGTDVDVLRFEVSMDDAAVVHGHQRREDLLRDFDRVLDFNLLTADDEPVVFFRLISIFTNDFI